MYLQHTDLETEREKTSRILVFAASPEKPPLHVQTRAPRWHRTSPARTPPHTQWESWLQEWGGRWWGYTRRKSACFLTSRLLQCRERSTHRTCLILADRRDWTSECHCSWEKHQQDSSAERTHGVNTQGTRSAEPGRQLVQLPCKRNQYRTIWCIIYEENLVVEEVSFLLLWL